MNANDPHPSANGSELKTTLLGGVAARTLRLVPPPPATSPGPYVQSQTLRFEEAAVRAATPPAESTTRRTTVLPRRCTGELTAELETRPRFQRVKTLGEGAMGRVELVRDNDIRRTVAVKRLHDGMDGAASLARFADEIRIVGQLEHPGIVPIYDVDKGEDGQPFLVMKHLEGETMERVIEQLRAGNPGYVERFTVDYRVRVFLGVLDAMSYAHARGVLHRDLKPANIMIGPYGEVTVVDWGIAKPLGPRETASPPDAMARTLVDSQDARLVETQGGALAGTPLYMSPEQAAALELDERSDVYTLCLLFFEWLVLEHPLQHLQSVPQVLATLVLNDYTQAQLFGPSQRACVPMEYAWIVQRGLVRDRGQRYQSVSELEAAINAVHGGHIAVRCDITLAKSYTQRFLHWIDRNPGLYRALFRGALGVSVALVFGTLTFALISLLGA